jgi:hypothetical protein
MPHSDSNANAASNAPASLSANLDTEVGRVVVETGLATRTEIEFCRESQKQSSDPNQRSLADLLVENSFITVNQAKRIARSSKSGRTASAPAFTPGRARQRRGWRRSIRAKQRALERRSSRSRWLPKRSSENPEFVDRFYKEGNGRGAACRTQHRAGDRRGQSCRKGITTS